MSSYASWYMTRTCVCDTEPDISFANWVNVVEKIVYNKLGVKLLDLPDESYMISFQEGITEKEMAKYVIKSFLL